MSKAKKEIVEAGIIKLLTNISGSMPSTTHKFIFGGASVLTTLKGQQMMNNMLGIISDDEGLVDIDQLKSVLDGAFKASNDKLEIKLFEPSQIGLLSAIVKPVTLTITRSDIDDIIAEIEANSIQNVQIIQPAN